MLRAITKQSLALSLSSRITNSASRPFHVSRALLNGEEKKPIVTPRPLLRVAIGGAKDPRKQYSGSSSIEFALWKAVVILIITGSGFTYWFTREKERLRLQKEADSRKSVGKPLIGGPFNLIDTENKPFTQKDLVKDNTFSLIYFGFTHCPDICPEELDKMGEMLDALKSDKLGMSVQPVFITCDPARDSPEIVKQYLEDFHPGIVGLTGSFEDVKSCCKKYRVYFSTPPDVKPGQDYLVDHSIFFYLMDPEGNFVDVIGREVTAEEAAHKISLYMDAFIPEAEREKRKDLWLGFLYK